MEWRLFPEGTVPEFTTAEWYAGRERAPHLEQDGHRERLRRAASFVVQALNVYGGRTVSDLGAGDGGLLSLIAPHCDCWGYDLQRSNIEGARARRVTVYLADLIDYPYRYGDVSVCTEMLEHLIDPHAFVREIPSGCVVASSPAYETDQFHYENHCWAWDVDGYLALFEDNGWAVMRHEFVGGFQVVLAERRERAQEAA